MDGRKAVGLRPRPTLIDGETVDEDGAHDRQKRIPFGNDKQIGYEVWAAACGWGSVAWAMRARFRWCSMAWRAASGLRERMAR